MHKIENKQLTGKQAAKQLGLSLRQVRRFMGNFFGFFAWVGVLSGYKDRSSLNLAVKNGVLT